MTAIQQLEHPFFGTGRLYATDSTGQRFVYAELADCTVDIKVDLKEYWTENTFAAGVANGHTAVDIMAKHFRMALKPMATDLGLAAPAAGTYATVVDEQGTIATNTYTLVNAAQMVAGSEVVYLTKTNNGVNYDIPMVRVASSPVAGVSYTISAGVLTFAVGDNNSPIKVTYDYTNTNGQQITLQNVPQNSAPFYQMQLVKRDKSPIDGSTGLFIAKFNAVRAGGFKLGFKENEWNQTERTFKAFTDTSGVCAIFQWVNI